MSDRKNKVYVGMSGGVDSSLTASLLLEQGYNVVGVYMKNWTQDIAGFECPWKEDYQDAKRVAVKLGIDFLVFDFQKEYKQKVVDYMIDEYKAGRTPNPDIMCNQEVKFKLFLDLCLEKGADFIATGHYARTKNGKLLKAEDSNKDQTYFLYRISESALKKTIFPIGDFKNKQEVRTEAKKRGLQTAEKKDSQGICFVGKVGIKDFLSEYVKTEVGIILDENSVNIGTHEGAIFYTIGQRHGLSVGGGLPYYVTGKDIEKNIVYVTTNLSDESLWSKKIIISDLHWINGNKNQDLLMNKKTQVRTRHRAKLIDVESAKKLKNNQLKLTIKDEIRALTPGQSAVIYFGDEVLGGGIVV